MDLYDSTGGANWGGNSNWLTKEPVSSWDGITVNGGRVTSISLDLNHLKGSIPSSLVSLTNLTDLFLGGNQFRLI